MYWHSLEGIILCEEDWRCEHVLCNLIRHVSYGTTWSLGDLLGVMICHLAVLESLMAMVLDGWLACCLRGTIPEDELPYLG